MWKTKRDQAPLHQPGRRTNNGVMAHRRAVASRQVMVATLLMLVFAVLLVGSVYVSSRVTGLRAEIARLEDRREFLEAGSARLLLVWNKATAPAVITARAQAELGLVAPTEPGLVLVQLPADEQRISPWRRLLANVGGGDEAQAAGLNPRWVMGSMVSLTPRQTRVRGDD
jgi:cell division protein FtsB